MEGASSERRAVSSRSILDKGCVLRKRCGQIKPKEVYLQEEPIVTLGYSPISVSELRSFSSCPPSTGPSSCNSCGDEGVGHSHPLTDSFLVPSQEALLHFAKVLLEASVHITTDMSMVFMQTTLRSTLAEASYAVRQALQELLQSSLTLRPLLFLNELCPHTVTPRRIAVRETTLAHSHRQVSVAMDFFRHMLLMPLSPGSNAPPGFSTPPSLQLLVADEEDSAWMHHHQEQRGSVRIITMQQFVTSVCGTRSNTEKSVKEGGKLHPLWELLDTASAARQSVLHPPSAPSSSSWVGGHQPYLSPQDLRRGLQEGRFVTGELNVFPYCSQEAEVVFEKSLPLTLALPPTSATASGEHFSIGSCLISGLEHRNRAVQGDVVVVQLLPREEWRAKTSSLQLQRPSAEDEVAGVLDEEEEGEVGGERSEQTPFAGVSAASISSSARLPTGRVVGIFKRSAAINEIVATFPMLGSGEHNGSKVGGENEVNVDRRERAVLLVPLDRRLPKIRVRTRNCLALGGRRVVVALDSWGLQSKVPSGHIVRTLTAVGIQGADSGDGSEDLKADVEAMLLKNSIYPRPFSLAAMACLPDLSHVAKKKEVTGVQVENEKEKVGEGGWRDSRWRVPEGEEGMQHRRDLRGACVRDLALLLPPSRTTTAATGSGGTLATPPSLSSVIATSFDDLEAAPVPGSGSGSGSGCMWENEKVRIFSVDPQGCQDIDDAMSITRISTPEGRHSSFLLGIHIADVTAFVPEGCALDLEARSRATTVYLPHQRLDMLPALLASDVASLHAGDRERYAMTLFFLVQITRRSTGEAIYDEGFGGGARMRDTLLALDAEDDLEVSVPPLPCWAGRTALCSSAAMTYDQAHRLLHDMPPEPPGCPHVPPGVAGGPLPPSLWDPVTGDLALLTCVSRCLARQRKGAGALDLVQQEGGQLKFGLDPVSGLPRTVQGSSPLEIHSTIAELMILANGAVARLVYHYSPSCTLLRSHGAASLDKLQEIRDLGATMGLRVFDGSGGDEDKESGDSVTSQDSSSGSSSSSSSAGPQALISQAHMDVHEVAHRQLLHYKSTVEAFARKMRTGRAGGRGGRGEGDQAAVDFFTAMVIRAMNEAKYVCSEATSSGSSDSTAEGSLDPGKQFEHFGLGLQYYTHYTSPIRRYADIIVHRQLLLVLQFIARERRQQHLQQVVGSNLVPVDSSIIASGMRNLTVVLPPSATISLLEPPQKVKKQVAIYVPEQQVEEQQVEEQDDDLDFLDDMLEGVGDSLLGPPPSCPLAGGEQKQTEAHTEEDEVNDFLEDMLGEVTEDLLASSHASGNTVSSSVWSTSAENKDTATVPVAPVTVGDVSASPSLSSSLPTSSTPLLYSPGQLGLIAHHLNLMNRRSKRVQYEAQELFLRHYFAHCCEVHHALVYSLRGNGFLAFLPAFQVKGPVYLTSDTDVVRGHPKLFEGNNIAKSKGGWKVGAAATESDTEQADFPGFTCVLQRGGATRLTASDCDSQKNNAKDMSKSGGDQCEENEEEEGREMEELVVRRTDGKVRLRLRYMQRVLVTVTARPELPTARSSCNASRVCSLPELRFTLLSTDEEEVISATTSFSESANVANQRKRSIKSKKDSDTKIKPASGPVLPHQSETWSSSRDAEGVLKKSKKKKHSIAPNDKESSFYALLRKFRQNIDPREGSGGFAEKKDDEPHSASVDSDANKSKVQQQLRARVLGGCQGRRWELPSTGRICFIDQHTSAADTGNGRCSGDNVRGDHICRSNNTAFQASMIFNSKGRLTDEGGVIGSKLSKTGSKPFGASQPQLGREEERESGRGLALYRMQQWGEEWAEEEDLPSAFSGQAQEQSFCGGGSIGPPLSSSVQKQVAQATARQQKIKVAKRNSKY